MLTRIPQALRLSPLPRVALVGAGGKTTALFLLARQLSPPVIVTTTTHLAVAQLTLGDQHFVVEWEEDIRLAGKEFTPGVTVLSGPKVEEERVSGLAAPLLEHIRKLADEQGAAMLIEADGSRMRPVKGPGEHEPVIPSFVDTVVVVAGLSALGKPLTSAWAHRPERFSALSGLPLGAMITPEALASALRNPRGGLKNIPEGARRLVLLNQADTPQAQAQARGMAAGLLDDFHGVIIASLRPEEGGEGQILAVHERVAGVILAAGESRRFGELKQGLLWRGEPLVRHVAKAALKAGLSPVVVVVGANAEQVGAMVEDLPVHIVVNTEWRAGQSSSVQAGLRALPAETGAAVFLLADQPQVQPTLVRRLVEEHAQSLSPIVAPQIDGERGNPVLFDRETFDGLSALSGDVGGRALFHRYKVSWVPWHDRAMLLDVDTPEDYRRLKESG